MVDFNLKVNNGGTTSLYNSSNGLNTSTWTTIYYNFTTPVSTSTVMTVQFTSNTGLGTVYVANLQIYTGTGSTPISTVLTGNLAIPYGDITVNTINNVQALPAFACAYIANNGTTATASNTRGVILTPTRNGTGVVTLTLSTAHPAGVYYTINAMAYVTSSASNPVICSLIKLPTTSTQFRVLTKDHTNTAVDCDFVVSVI